MVRIGPERVRERSRILGELRRAERPHVLDPLDRGRPLIGRKALVAIDGEALLQRKLEPVAAGDAIARPIVEIFVRDDARVIVERSEEHTSELQSLMRISYAVFCLKKQVLNNTTSHSIHQYM